MSRTDGVTTKKASTCSHYDGEVQVGPYVVVAGGTNYFQQDDFKGVDLLVPLTDWVPMLEFGARYSILALPLKDFGGVPEKWKESVELVIDELKAGKKVLTFCVGSHGRTGCMLGSLIALLESAEETPDPIEAVRTRHCNHAVETLAQAEAIFALRGQELPQKYRVAFSPREKQKK